jgi:hypothetical protein
MPQTFCVSIPLLCLFITPSVYLFAAEQRRQQQLRFDPECLYVAAAFHDLGLIKKFSSQNERFDVDGADAARQFLTAHNVPEEQIQTVWEAIALHTTRGVTQYMRPELALLHSGVGLDALGKGFDQFPSELRAAIAARYDSEMDFVERGTGLEPATSTLGTLRQPSTSVDDCLHLMSVQSEMSKGVDTGPYPTVGKLWECGKKLRSVTSVPLWSVGKSWCRYDRFLNAQVELRPR